MLYFSLDLFEYALFVEYQRENMGVFYLLRTDIHQVCGRTKVGYRNKREYLLGDIGLCVVSVRTLIDPVLCLITVHGDTLRLTQ